MFKRDNQPEITRTGSSMLVMVMVKKRFEKTTIKKDLVNN